MHGVGVLIVGCDECEGDHRAVGGEGREIRQVGSAARLRHFAGQPSVAGTAPQDARELEGLDEAALDAAINALVGDHPPVPAASCPKQIAYETRSARANAAGRIALIVAADEPYQNADRVVRKLDRGGWRVEQVVEGDAQHVLPEIQPDDDAAILRITNTTWKLGRKVLRSAAADPLPSTNLFYDVSAVAFRVAPGTRYERVVEAVAWATTADSYAAGITVGR